jgi:hypothetical protein
MLIWINGPFGVGKTHVAHELRYRLPEAFVFDPELVGIALRQLVPPSLARDDFQDLPTWRRSNADALLHLLSGYGGTVLAPMTVTEKSYLDEIIGPLRQAGIAVRHFTLLATATTVRGRLRRRFDGTHSWGTRHLERCLAALRADDFAEHIETEDKAVEQVAEEIAQQVGLILRPRSGRLATRLRRLLLTWQHIRS